MGRLRLRGDTSANRRKPTTRVFEVLPPSGILLPGQKINVQVKFTPADEVIPPLFLEHRLISYLD